MPLRTAARVLLALLAGAAMVQGPRAATVAPTFPPSDAAPPPLPRLERRTEPPLPMAADTAPAPRPDGPAQLAFVSPRAGLPEAPGVATLDVPGAAGHFLVPFIQTTPDL